MADGGQLTSDLFDRPINPAKPVVSAGALERAGLIDRTWQPERMMVTLFTLNGCTAADKMAAAVIEAIEMSGVPITGLFSGELEIRPSRNHTDEVRPCVVRRYRDANGRFVKLPKRAA